MLGYQRDIWSCPSGALYHRTLRRFAPLDALIGAIDEISARFPRAGRAALAKTRANALSSQPAFAPAA